VTANLADFDVFGEPSADIVEGHASDLARFVLQPHAKVRALPAGVTVGFDGIFDDDLRPYLPPVAETKWQGNQPTDQKQTNKQTKQTKKDYPRSRGLRLEMVCVHG